MTWRSRFLNNAATLCLMLGLFFNPAGFDALFALVMKWTGSYWITDLIFYGIAVFFLILSYLFKRSAKKHTYPSISPSSSVSK